MTSLETNRCITHVPLTWHNPCQERFCAHIYENHEVTEVDSLVDVVGNGHELRRLQVLYDAEDGLEGGYVGLLDVGVRAVHVGLAVFADAGLELAIFPRT